MSAVHVILMMNCVPFTRGHEFMVDYLANFRTSFSGVKIKRHIFVNHTKNDIISSINKSNIVGKAVKASGSYDISVVTWNSDANLPRAEPSEEYDFDYWGALFDMIKKSTESSHNDFFIFMSSDRYVEKVEEMWKILQSPRVEHLVIDPYRTFAKTNATRVRNDPFTFWDDISPLEQPLHRKKLILFGAESVGKTTLAKRISNEMSWDMTDEWARPYLEAKTDKTVTLDDMADIVINQSNFDKVSNLKAKSPVLVQDTNIISTYGYYLLSKMPQDAFFVSSREYAKEAALDKNNYYVVLDQKNVPFEADPLRYGGDKRESSDDFWLNLLSDLGAKRVIYMDPTKEKNVDKLIEHMIEEVGRTFSEYKRPT